MKKIKAFIVASILFFTMLSILYLVYIAKQIEKYAISRNDGRTCIILYSSSGGKYKNDASVEKVLSNLSESLTKTGNDSINLGIKNNVDSNELGKQLVNEMKSSKKYILVDINTSGLIYSKNTILIKLSNKTSKYKDNLDYANKIKETLSSRNVNTNIMVDGKGSLNQNLGYRAIRIEMSSQINVEEGVSLMDSIVEGIVK